MPTVELDPTLTSYYEDDCFVDPWLEPETVLLVHGVAESSRAWYGWVPHLARHYRVLRFDQRGFGRSTIPPPGFPWSPASFAADLARFLDALGLASVHLVGAKFGGTISLRFAASYPERIRGLTVLGSPVRARHPGGPDMPPVPARIAEVGVRRWAAETQRTRLGPDVPSAQVEWWTGFMAAANQRSCIGASTAAAQSDLLSVLPTIQAPTLIVTGEDSSMEKAEGVREWQRTIPNSELLVLPGGLYHVAAARPDECARHVLAFLRRHPADQALRPVGS